MAALVCRQPQRHRARPGPHPSRRRAGAAVLDAARVDDFLDTHGSKTPPTPTEHEESMSSPAPSPAVQPNSQEATAAWPHQPFDGMRRLPLRDAQPPFDDEVAMFTATVDPRQGALKLAFALPNGLPAIPQASPSPRVDDDERMPHLRL